MDIVNSVLITPSCVWAVEPLAWHARAVAITNLVMPCGVSSSSRPLGRVSPCRRAYATNLWRQARAASWILGDCIFGDRAITSKDASEEVRAVVTAEFCGAGNPPDCARRASEFKTQQETVNEWVDEWVDEWVV